MIRLFRDSDFAAMLVAAASGRRMASMDHDLSRRYFWMSAEFTRKMNNILYYSDEVHR